MKYTLIKTVAIYLLTAFPLLADAATQKVSIKQSVLVGDGIAKFIPEGFDAKKVPSFAIEKEPRERDRKREAYSLPIGYLFPNSPSQMVKLMHHLQYRKAQVSTEVVK